MSDDFIPLNQSTPQRKSQHQHHQTVNQNHSDRQNNRFHGKNRRGGHNNRWGNNSRNSSFGSDSNTSFNRSHDRNTSSSIDAYLHPSMLEDPWARLRQQQQQQTN